MENNPNLKNEDIFDDTFNTDEFRNFIKSLTPLNKGIGWLVGEQIGNNLIKLGCKEGKGFTVSKLIKP